MRPLRNSLLAVAAIGLTACTNAANTASAPNTVPGRVIDGQAQPALAASGPAAQSFGSVPQAQLDAFARSYLNTAQRLSFRDGVEYCGFFFQDASGQIQSTTPSAGGPRSCAIGTPPAGLLAGWHTHSSYSADVIAEVPSPNDMVITFSIGLDGYVATPGGRLWRMNAQAQNTVLLCDTGCLLADPRFVEDPRLEIQPVFTLRSLLESLNVGAARSGRTIIER